MPTVGDGPPTDRSLWLGLNPVAPRHVLQGAFEPPRRNQISLYKTRKGARVGLRRHLVPAPPHRSPDLHPSLGCSVSCAGWCLWRCHSSRPHYPPKTTYRAAPPTSPLLCHYFQRWLQVVPPLLPRGVAGCWRHTAGGHRLRPGLLGRITRTPALCRDSIYSSHSNNARCPKNS